MIEKNLAFTKNYSTKPIAKYPKKPITLKPLIGNQIYLFGLSSSSHLQIQTNHKYLQTIHKYFILKCKIYGKQIRKSKKSDPIFQGTNEILMTYCKEIASNNDFF